MSEAVVEQNQQVTGKSGAPKRLVRSRPSAPGEWTREQVRRFREDGSLITRGL